MKEFQTKNLVRIALLAALAFLLTFIYVTPPIFPSFLKLELSDIPAVIGALAISPMAGILIGLVKNIIDLVYKPVALGVGQAANFIIGTALILPFAYIYRKKGTVKWFTIGSAAGIITAVLIACIANYFVLIPLYANVFGITVKQVVAMTSVVNGAVSDFRTFILFAIAPFNLIKYTLEAVLGFFIYKAVRPLLFTD
ncbi:riboflavin transporter [Clostridia bacterium]|nr:riboflavin transporter [Clostridia bacterium]